MAWQLKGAVLHLLGRYDEAVKAFKKALEIDPRLEGAQEGKGLALAAMGKLNESTRSYAEVLDYFDNAIKMANSTQNLSDAWLSKGLALQEQGRYEEALKALDKSTCNDSGNEKSWMCKGAILAKDLHRYNESLEAYDCALRIDPKDASVWNLKADALGILSRSSEAEAAHAEARKLSYNA